MTERKPPDVSLASWVDQLITAATDRGAFDDLPGTGKPLPKKDETDDGLAWIRDKLRSEGESTQALLPTPLKLRRETELLAENIHLIGAEQHVREAVAELNRRIMDWRMLPVGPPIFVPLADEELMVSEWWRSRPAPPPTPPPPVASQPADSRQARTRWWRRGRPAAPS